MLSCLTLRLDKMGASVLLPKNFIQPGLAPALAFHFSGVFRRALFSLVLDQPQQHDAHGGTAFQRAAASAHSQHHVTGLRANSRKPAVSPDGLACVPRLNKALSSTALPFGRRLDSRVNIRETSDFPCPRARRSEKN
jgi:hypothetical protein